MSKHLGQQAGRIYHAVSPSFAIEIFKNPVFVRTNGVSLYSANCDQHNLSVQFLLHQSFIETGILIAENLCCGSFNTYSINLLKQYFLLTFFFAFDHSMLTPSINPLKRWSGWHLQLCRRQHSILTPSIRLLKLKTVVLGAIDFSFNSYSINFSIEPRYS